MSGSETRLRLSWVALALAPLGAPTLIALLMTATLTDSSRGVAFLIFLAVGSAMSYGATIILLLPTLWLVARRAAIDRPRAAGIGLALGALLVLPLDWVIWNASGDDSGPPTTPFFEHLLDGLADPVLWVVPLSGMITAFLYWHISTRS